jgi:hypothetical protein
MGQMGFETPYFRILTIRRLSQDKKTGWGVIA